MSNQRQTSCQEVFPLPDEMVEAAIDWTLRMRFNVPDENTSRAFEIWLQSDARHAEAWRQMQCAQKGFDALPGDHVMSILEKVSEKRRSRGISRRSAIKLAFLGGIALVAGWNYQYYLSPSPETDRVVADTQTGERRTLQLSEGTVIELNTDTALRVEFNTLRRHVHLLHGEVFISAGKDVESTSRRPFWVETSFGSLEALGTRFNVRLMPESARITVLEGAVRMAAASGRGSVAEAGETWMLDSRDVRQIADFSLNAVDWIDGILVAKNMPLADFLAELARYRPGKIICDPRVANLKVSGIYHIKDTDKALVILSQSLPVTLTGLVGSRVHVGPLPHSALHSEFEK